MNNHVLGLEDSFGTFKWELTKEMSEALRKYPEDAQRQYLSFYQEFLSVTMHYTTGLMSLPPVLQQKYASAYLKMVQILAHSGIEELKRLKEELK